MLFPSSSFFRLIYLPFASRGFVKKCRVQRAFRGLRMQAPGRERVQNAIYDSGQGTNIDLISDLRGDPPHSFLRLNIARLAVL